MLRALPILIYTAVLVFTIVDIVMMDEQRIRALPKWGWIMLVILLPAIGIVLWFVVGRERLAKREHGRYPTRPQRPTGPDDDPAFLGRLGRDKEQEDRIRDLERRLRDLDGDAGAGSGSAGAAGAAGPDGSAAHDADDDENGGGDQRPRG